MDQIIWEVIAGLIFVTLVTVVVINIRQGEATVGKGINAAMNAENQKNEIFFNDDKFSLDTGDEWYKSDHIYQISDIISVIRYYEKDTTVLIFVTINGNTKKIDVLNRDKDVKSVIDDLYKKNHEVQFYLHKVMKDKVPNVNATESIGSQASEKQIKDYSEIFSFEKTV